MRALILILCPIFWVAAVIAQPVIPLDFVRMVGGPGDSLGQFNRPSAITVDHIGNLYVADAGNHRVQKFDTKGNFISYLGGIGTGNRQFDSPLDLNVRDGLNVFVADYNNHRIHRLDRKLNPISIISGSGYGNETFQFSFPRAIAIARQGDLFVIESENNGILKFNAFFTLVARFGSIETGEGYLSAPIQIEILGDEFLAVSDSQAGHLVIFDYFGNFIRNLGGDRLGRPAGLFYSSKRNLLLVTDLADAKVHGFTAKQWVGELKPIQTTSTGWQDPVDVAAFMDRLFVLDQEEEVIHEYKILNAME